MSTPDTSSTEVVTTYTLAGSGRVLLGGAGVAVLLPARRRLDGLSAAQLTVLRALNSGAFAVVGDPDRSTAALLDVLVDAGVVSITVSVGNRVLYGIRPFHRPPAPRPDAAAPTPAPTLSKFTVIHRVGDEVIAENPNSWCDVVIADAGVLGELTGVNDGSDYGSQIRSRLIADACWTGHMVDSFHQSPQLSSSGWSTHELWFHRNSTVGKRAAAFDGFGPTRWAEGTFSPLPARPEPYAGTTVSLPTPPIDELVAADRPLAWAVEQRRSIRAFDDLHPISAAQLGELLYRCCRTRSTRVVNSDPVAPEELPSRPYPSGGSLYEIEIYAVIHNAANLPRGFYHYDSFDHTLEHVAAYDNPAVERLLAPAALTLNGGQLPQVMLVFAARTGRLMWTYEKMSYAVILKHVGVLTQTMYLAVTAMGLGGVAQGYGDTEAFADATGRDELTECNVGTFVVGTPAK